MSPEALRPLGALGPPRALLAHTQHFLMWFRITLRSLDHDAWLSNLQNFSMVIFLVIVQDWFSEDKGVFGGGEAMCLSSGSVAWAHNL